MIAAIRGGNNSDKKGINEAVVFLKKLGCCLRCLLRLFGLKATARAYETSALAAKKLQEYLGPASAVGSQVEDEESRPEKKVAPSPCSVCLGLLDRGCDEQQMQEIIENVRGQGYAFSTFHLHTSVPVTINLRNHIIVAKLRKAFPDIKVDKESVIVAKEVYRLLLAKRIGAAFDARLDSDAPFTIHLSTSHDDVEAECSFLFEKHRELLHPKQCRKSMNLINAGPHPSHFNHSSIQRAIESLSSASFTSLPLECPNKPYTVDSVMCINSPVYIIGRYNKFSRCLSQSPWVVEGDKKVTGSVQELIVDTLMKIIPAERSKFSASGREDVDVRMLGRGRPFVIELVDPKRRDISEETLIQVEDQVNSNTEEIAIRDLQTTSKDDVSANLKEGESNKQKRYTATCCANRPITDEDIKRIEEINCLQIEQKTPIRVLHRRTLSTRKKVIHKASATKDPTDPRIFRLNLLTEAGTYIKEFVHSDFGRTRPSLATLLGNCRTDIIDLDVMEICTDWPPTLRRNNKI